MNEAMNNPEKQFREYLKTEFEEKKSTCSAQVHCVTQQFPVSFRESGEIEYLEIQLEELQIFIDFMNWKPNLPWPVKPMSMPQSTTIQH